MLAKRNEYKKDLESFYSSNIMKKIEMQAEEVKLIE